jgi:1,4-dihydroxy-2-naphthoate octaprenyltransferase
VVTGWGLAWHSGVWEWKAAVACLLIALLLQAGSNLANDVFDFERGTDTPERLGPTRVTQSGLLTPRQVKIGMGLVFGLAVVLGLYLFLLRGGPVLIIGAASILAAIAYTGGPYPLAYHGLGELFVFLFFGLAAVAGTYYVMAGSVTPVVWWMAIPPGLIITAILVVNNLRDLENDRKGGKHTLAVRLGEKNTRIEYLVLLVLAYAVMPVAAILGLIPWFAVLAWGSLPLAIESASAIFRLKGRALNATLASTGQTALLFSLLFWVGLALGR